MLKDKGSYASEAEQSRRYAELDSILAEEECPAALVVGTPQIGGKRYFRYFTDWNLQSIGGYLLRWQGGPVEAVFRASSQAFWARLVDWVEDIVSDSQPAKYVIRRLVDANVSHVAVVGQDYMPVSEYLILVETFPGRVKDLTHRIDRLMAVKSPEEIQSIEATAEIFDGAWRRVLENARPGLTEWELASIAAEELARKGVPHHVILIGASSNTFAATCPGWPRNRQLDRDDIVQMSLEGPGPAGYSVEVGGMLSFAPPDSSIRRQFAAHVDAVIEGASLLRPGNSAGSVASAIGDAFRKGGLTPGYWSGHGIGLGITEEPTIEVGNDRLLESDMVIALHPNAVGIDGRGTLVSRTYSVGAHEGKALSKIPIQWEVV